MRARTRKLFALLIAAGLFVSACAGNLTVTSRTSETEKPTTVVSPEPTVEPTASPPEPEPAPTDEPEPTKPPQAEKPTLVSGPLISKIRFRFGPEVPPSQRQRIKRLARQANRFFAIPHERGSGGQVQFFVYDDFEKLVAVFARVTGKSKEDARVLWEDRFTSGQTFRNAVFLYLGRGWYTWYSQWRAELVYHEFFHVIQNHLANGWAYFYVWYLEGAAEWAAAKAVVHFERGWSYASWRSYNRRRAFSVPVKLELLASGEAFRASDADGDQYGLAFMALDFLMKKRPVKKLLRFYRQLGEEHNWQQALKDNFGFTLQEFYRKFERYRARGFVR